VDLKFDPNSNPPAYVSEDQNTRIEKGESVRMRLIGTRVDATEIVRRIIFFRLKRVDSVSMLTSHPSFFLFQHSLRLEQFETII
jgi:DNA-directed RNA polymerase subunit E'/Rpb7